MPQLDFSSFASQIFWLAISFLTLYIIMVRVSLPKVRDVLQNRSIRIANDLKKAEQLKVEAEKAEADFTSLIVKARDKAHIMITEAREAVDQESVKRHGKLDETFARQQKEADQRAKYLRQETMEKLIPVTTDLALEITKKLANINLDSNKTSDLITSNINKQSNGSVDSVVEEKISKKA